MREKYESLSLATLKDLAKARGLKRISTLRKPELIERMLEEDEKETGGKTGHDNAAQGEKTQSEPQPEVSQEHTEPSGEGADSADGEEKQSGEDSDGDGADSQQEDADSQEHGGEHHNRHQNYRQNRQNNYSQDNRSGYDNRRRTYTTYNSYGGNNNYRSYGNQDNNRRYNNNDNRRSYNNDNRRNYGNQDENNRRSYGSQGYNSGQNSHNNQDENRRNYSSSQDDTRRTYGNNQNYNNQNYNNQNYNNNNNNNSQSYNNQNGSQEENKNSYANSQDDTRRTYSNVQEESRRTYTASQEAYASTDELPPETAQLDSGEKADGILEVLPDGYGFIRCENYLPGENDIYVSPAQIRRFNLKTGDILQGNIRIKTQGEKFSALLYVTSVNGFPPSEAQRRYNFEDMTPIFPNKRLQMERPGGSMAMRIVDLISPIGKGQRGMIVSPPKAGKTTLLKDVAKSILRNSPDMHLIILLIDERPEEVTDIREAIQGPNVEVIYSTFDELPEHHRRVSEMVVERARRLVEHKKDVTILLDSITRLARAYNLCVPPSGRTLSGGLDPAALHMPKRFFGAARNMREGGSLTILATALVDTGSKMDDVIYEEFKGTGNMELVLDRKLQEKRVFPAIDIQKSGTRREDLLLTRDEQETVYSMRKALNSLKADEAVEQILNMFSRTRSNAEFVYMAKKQKFL